ncbi:MAG: TMEM165/GDT1 family protein [Treponema sp.]|nr:TMEM165/GDT1 family protein [Candidatus Treponema equifaecale]
MVSLLARTFLTFLATEIDDFIVYVLFFGQNKKSKASIFFGRLLATFVIAVLCGFVAQLLSKIPQNYLRFLGFVPFVLGIIRIFKKDDDDEETAPKTASLFLASFLLTCASSGDNVGIYIPFFVSMTFSQKLTSICGFVILQILWSLLQIKASDLPLVQKIIERFGRILVPVVFIVLGISIFFGL